MRSGVRWAWVVGALVAAVAGCTPEARPPARAFAAGCPVLSAPPSGIEATGKRIPGEIAPGDRDTLDRVAPGAQLEYVICQYAGPGPAQPGVEVNARVFHGDRGTAHAKALADADQIATSELYADYLTVPASGDNGGFAWYDEPSFCLATYSGDAYVVVAMTDGADAAEDVDMRQSLRRQMPALTAIMTDALAAIQ